MFTKRIPFPQTGLASHTPQEAVTGLTFSNYRFSNTQVVNQT